MSPQAALGAHSSGRCAPLRCALSPGGGRRSPWGGPAARLAGQHKVQRVQP